MAMAGSVEELQARGEALHGAVSSLPPEVLTPDCRARLLKVVQAERNFVARLASKGASAIARAHLCSTNFGHLEGIVYVLQQQGWRIAGANAVLKTFHIPSLETTMSTRGIAVEEEYPPSLHSRYREKDNDIVVATVAHVDIICTLLGRAVWVVVVTSSERNRCWWDKGDKRGLQTRICSLLHAASLDSVARPSGLLLVVRHGLENAMEKQLQDEFRSATLSRVGKHMHIKEEKFLDTNWSFSEMEDGDWVNVCISNNATRWGSYWIKINSHSHDLDSRYIARSESLQDTWANILETSSCDEDAGLEQETLHKASCKVSSSLWSSILQSIRGRHEEYEGFQRQGRILNLDTTSLVALVSELTNGGAQHLVQMSPEERERRFPSMAKFVSEQAQLELERPQLPQFQDIFADRLLVISEYVRDEFTSIVEANGGGCEQRRAKEMLSFLKVVPNMTSARVMALPDTGKIKARHKLVFGTSDVLQATTVTANMAFVRAVHQRGMALAVIQHQPCALTGV